MSEPRVIEIKDPRAWAIKISLGAVIGIFVVGGILAAWSHTILDASFLTDSAYASDQSQIQLQIRALKFEQTRQNNMMSTHIIDFNHLSKNIQLADAVSTYRNAEQALYLHELDQDRNGSTTRSTVRHRELKSERNSAKEFRDCVVGNQPNCEALRPR